jgi:hypothetical protein
MVCTQLVQVAGKVPAIGQTAVQEDNGWPVTLPVEPHVDVVDLSLFSHSLTSRLGTDLSSR